MDGHFINSTVGRRFLEYTMPELVRQITKLNEHLEKLISFEEEPLKPSIGEVNKEIKAGMNKIIHRFDGE